MNLQQKQDWTNRALDHQKADRFIQGTWIDEQTKVGDFYRGCMFGCMTQSSENTIHKASEEMDIPDWLNHLAERIFEGLQTDQAVLFPAQFIQALPVDLTEAQYDDIWHKTSAARLRRTLEYIKDIEDQWGVNDSVNSIIDLHESEWDESAARSASWSAARSASWSAAESAARSASRSAAESASWSAAESASWSAAESAAESASWSAAESAESAARSAESAARSAARSAEYKAERDFLLSLFTEMEKTHGP